jgi:pimeloyl-ACP methyl ester carboxylesterase
VTITRRVLTNGSIYIEMAHLSAGQELLLALPDERLPAEAPIGEEGVTSSLAATFGPRAEIGTEELGALWELISHGEGHRILPRLIRYIEERRENERRFTGAIEDHPSPLTVVWGTEDPIALAPMAERLRATRPETTLVWLEGIGHYPMLEAPERFLEGVVAGLG